MKKIIAVLLFATILVGCVSNKATSIDISTVTKSLMSEDQFAKNSVMDTDKVELKYGVDLSDMEEGVFCFPSDSESANMFIIVKAKDGTINDLKSEIDIIVDMYDHSWTDLVYNAEEAEKVKAKTVSTFGNYYVCVISNDNKAVMDKIVK